MVLAGTLTGERARAAQKQSSRTAGAPGKPHGNAWLEVQVQLEKPPIEMATAAPSLHSVKFELQVTSTEGWTDAPPVLGSCARSS